MNANLTALEVEEEEEELNHNVVQTSLKNYGSLVVTETKIEPNAAKTEKKVHEIVPLYNFRDVLEYFSKNPNPKHKPLVQHIYRSASVSRGMVNRHDVKKILKFLTNTIKLQTIIDLREKSEKIKYDPFDLLVEETFPTVSLRQMNHFDNLQPRRICVPLINRKLKFIGLFWYSSWRIKLALIRTLIFSGFDQATQFFSKVRMNHLGLFGLSKLMLQYSPKEIGRILRILSDKRNYPAMIHCSSGKDRTGLICMFIQVLCNIDPEEIVNNYHESEIHLAPVAHLIRQEDLSRGLNEQFSGTPKFVMVKILKFINENYGGVPAYLHDVVGFTLLEQKKLSMLLSEGVEYEPTVEELYADRKFRVKHRMKQFALLFLLIVVVFFILCLVKYFLL